MGNQLSQALASAGLVAPEAVAKQAAQEDKRNLRRQHKELRKRHLQTDEGRVESYSSPSEFMEYARQRLKDEGYSAGLMNTIFREAHQFADAKLPKKQRGRMHAFLCQVKEKIEGTPAEQQQRVLRDGKRAFKQMKPRTSRRKEVEMKNLRPKIPYLVIPVSNDAGSFFKITRDSRVR